MREIRRGFVYERERETEIEEEITQRNGNSTSERIG